VWIDGVRFGATDAAGRLAISSISSGVHSVRVRSAGFSEVSKSIPAASRGEIQITLTKTTDEAELAFQAGDAMATLDRQKAIAEYQRATKLRAKYPEAHLALARMYAESGSIEKAFTAITTAKRLKPGFAEASAVEGRLLKDSGEEAKAIATFKRAIAEGRGFQPEAYTGLGILYKDKAENFGGSGDFEQETASYDQAARYLAVAVKQLGSAPDAIVVYQLLGLIFERQKRFKEAIAVYEEFLRKFSDTSEAGAVASFITQIKKQMAEQ
jgi:tetratricopeptide (TPR) repeat protein